MPTIHPRRLVGKKIPKPKTATNKPYHLEDGVTQSMLSDYVACRQRMRYILDGWETPATKEALMFGDLWHSFLQHTYQRMMRKREWPVFADLEKVVMQEKMPGLSGAAAQLMELQLCRAAALYPIYVQAWRADDLKRDWVLVEKSFDVPWEGYLLRGKRDGVFRAKKGSKGLFLLETKTSSAFDEAALEDALSFNFQNLFYIHTLEQTLNEPVLGVLYNCIRRPSLRFNPGKGETLSDHYQRLCSDVAARRETYFFRMELNYSDAKKERFREELRWKLDEFRAWLGEMPESNWHPQTFKNEQACIGKWRCEFLHACATGTMEGYARTRQLFSEL